MDLTLIPPYKVLVTGATGHIGQHLVRRLRAMGHDVNTFERYVSSRYGISSVQDKVLYGEITDYYAVREAVKKSNPTIVCHLAALGTQDLYAYQHPHENLLVHALGTINITEAVRDVVGNLELFLHASSSEVYGNHTYPDEFPLRENTPLIPNSPYAVGKIAAENHINYLTQAYAFPAVILRPFNTYGFGPARTLIDRVVREMLQKQPEINLGDPKPIRDWLHITDHVNAYIKCIENIEKAKGQTFNFCTGIPIPIDETVDQIRALTAYRGSINWNTQPQRPNDIFALFGSYEKAESLLGWKPEQTHVQGIRKLIEALQNG